MSEAAAEIGATVKAVQYEVSRLVPADLVRDRRRGRLRLIRAATDTVLARPLTDLLVVTYGSRYVLSDFLTDPAGIDEAYIYGSWAARYAGEAGSVPADVDVLVIGTASLDDLDEVALAAGRPLGRPVNIRRIRPDVTSPPSTGGIDEHT